MVHNSQLIALAQQHQGVIGAAQAAGRLHDFVQHRLKIVGRGSDPSKNITGRGLLPQRFLQSLFWVVRLRLHLVEQLRILAARLRQFRLALRHTLASVAPRLVSLFCGCRRLARHGHSLALADVRFRQGYSTSLEREKSAP